MSTASRVVPAIARNDGAFLSQELIQQGRLADIWPADDRQTNSSCFILHRDRFSWDRGRPARSSGITTQIRCTIKLSQLPGRLRMLLPDISTSASSISPNPMPCSAEIGNTSVKPNW